jgi:hypothetical protein
MQAASQILREVTGMPGDIHTAIFEDRIALQLYPAANRKATIEDMFRFVEAMNKLLRQRDDRRHQMYLSVNRPLRWMAATLHDTTYSVTWTFGIVLETHQLDQQQLAALEFRLKYSFPVSTIGADVSKPNPNDYAQRAAALTLALEDAAKSLIASGSWPFTLEPAPVS